jgi:hypothetical protein
VQARVYRSGKGLIAAGLLGFGLVALGPAGEAGASDLSGAVAAASRAAAAAARSAVLDARAQVQRWRDDQPAPTNRRFTRY